MVCEKKGTVSNKNENFRKRYLVVVMFSDLFLEKKM